MGRLKEWGAGILALAAGLAMAPTLLAQDYPLGKQRGVNPSVLPVSVDDEAQPPKQDPPAKPASPPMSQEAKDKEVEQLKKLLKDAQERLDRIAPAEPAPAHDPYSPEVSPFGFGDMSWAPAGYTPSKSSLKWGPFTGEVR
ncbi:MAG TPA: hypothetical protein VMU54_24755, partial [Planctomycetota bacterium]|nr:hypothetical protein [Planctomycetota bacterium]